MIFIINLLSASQFLLNSGSANYGAFKLIQTKPISKFLHHLITLIKQKVAIVETKIIFNKVIFYKEKLQNFKLNCKKPLKNDKFLQNKKHKQSYALKNLKILNLN